MIAELERPLRRDEVDPHAMLFQEALAIDKKTGTRSR